jgi:hypothetical protein
MKKLLIFSIISTLVCTVVFAEVSITAGAGMSFIPLGVITPVDGDPEAVTGFGRNGGAQAELQVNVIGATESGKAGFLFQWRPKLDASGLNASQVGDNAEVWYQPANWIRIEAGKFQNNDIRGRMGSGAWFGDYTLSRAGENDIFSNFTNPFGALVKLSPVDGLGIYATLKSAAGVDTYKDYKTPWGASRGAKWVWQNTQAAVSYAIPNIGLARAQFVGPVDVKPGKDSDDFYTPASDSDPAKYNLNSRSPAPRAEAAFAFTGVPGLTLDVGGKVWFPVSDPEVDTGTVDSDKLTVPGSADLFKDSITAKGYSYWGGIDVGLGLTYAASPLTATFIISAAKIGANFLAEADAVRKSNSPQEKVETTTGMEVKPHVAVQYKLNDTFTAQVEGGVVITGETKADDTVTGKGSLRYGFGAGLQTTVAPSCTIRTGITYAGGQNKNTDKNEIAVFSVPIIFSVSF